MSEVPLYTVVERERTDHAKLEDREREGVCVRVCEGEGGCEREIKRERVCVCVRERGSAPIMPNSKTTTKVRKACFDSAKM